MRIRFLIDVPVLTDAAAQRRATLLAFVANHPEAKDSVEQELNSSRPGDVRYVLKKDSVIDWNEQQCEPYVENRVAEPLDDDNPQPIPTGLSAEQVTELKRQSPSYRTSSDWYRIWKSLPEDMRARFAKPTRNVTLHEIHIARGEHIGVG